MIPILILNEEEVAKFTTDLKHILISICSPNQNHPLLPIQNSRLDVLKLKFHDIDDITFAKSHNFKYFSKYDARQVLKLVEKYRNKIDVILVNCEVGISRSAGVGGALSKIYNGDDSRYFKEYIPNRLVYRTILREYYGRE